MIHWLVQLQMNQHWHQLEVKLVILNQVTVIIYLQSHRVVLYLVYFPICERKGKQKERTRTIANKIKLNSTK
jgi:hypothetical protein